MYWLKFKDKFSEEIDLITLQLGRRKRAEEQIDVYEIPYRNDELIIHSDTYKPYEREVEFATMDRTKISLVNQWLRGRGELRTSLDPDGYFIASVISGLDFEAMSNGIDNFPVTFKVNPFFYLDSGTEAITITSPSLIYNPGTIYSEPYIKITGTGNIIFYINSYLINFTNVEGYIEINTELKTVYRDTLNQGEKMVGEFPRLTIGDNSIGWSGSVTSIEIIPKWREL